MPEGQNGIRKMALEYQERLETIRAGKEKTEEEKLLEILKKGDRKAAERAAREFLKDMKV